MRLRTQLIFHMLQDSYLQCLVSPRPARSDPTRHSHGSSRQTPPWREGLRLVRTSAVMPFERSRAAADASREVVERWSDRTPRGSRILSPHPKSHFLSEMEVDEMLNRKKESLEVGCFGREPQSLGLWSLELGDDLPCHFSNLVLAKLLCIQVIKPSHQRTSTTETLSSRPYRTL